MTTTAAKIDSDFAISLGKLLDDHKCGDVVVIDVSEQCSWTNFMAIATVSSSGHLSGVVKNLGDFFKERGLALNVAKKRENGESWLFIDMGDIVIHLMTKESREFYSIETLFHASKKL